MIGNTFIEVDIQKFHDFFLESLPKHNISQSLVDELIYHKFHSLNSFKKNYFNEIFNNYYGMHYVGLVVDSANESLKYKLQVTDKKLCTFFLLKYAS
jgi:hypothetical protein